MEAKDIVAEEVARQAEFGYEPSWEDFVIAGQVAGIREVVEWIEQYECTDEDCVRWQCFERDKWQSQKKEWGIKDEK